MTKENQKSNVVTPLTEALSTCRYMIKFALIFGALINILMLAAPIYSMQVLDRVLSSHNTTTLWMLTIIILVMIGLLSLLQCCRAFAMSKMGAWLEHSLASPTFSNSIQMSIQSKMNIGSQKINDLQSIKNFLMSPHFLAILDTPWAIIFLIVLFMLHFYIGMLALLGVALLIGIALLSDKLTKSLIEQTNEGMIKNRRYLDQATRNAEVVEAMSLRINLEKTWSRINGKMQNMQEVLTKRQAVLSEISKFIRMSLQILVTCIGAYLVLQNEISSGAIIAGSALIGRALAPFEQFLTAWKGAINFRKAYTRLNKAFELCGQQTEKMDLPPPEGSIELQGVHYVPNGTQKYILRNITASIEAGEIIVVIGHSGSGKTTLAKLLVGILQPTVGNVRIDGSSTKNWNQEYLGKYIGYLPQDVELFNGTVRENIGRMDKNADPEEVIKAAQIAGIHDIILQFPKGYDTEIGLEGSILSGGQRQRIGLARAFFKSPTIVVLDEPNSNLDMAGEKALVDAMEIARGEKITCIVISHRMSLVNYADKIMVLNNGMITNFAPKNQLINTMGQINIQPDPSGNNQ
jgi:PrtD family type I secretion system ABC transporter